MTTEGPIVLRDPATLGVHALLKNQPWMSPAEMDSLCGSVREKGVIEPLLITEESEIANGRHRWRASRQEHLKLVPCIIVPEDQVATIVLATTLERRHYSKSARAYLSLPLLEKAVSEGLQRRAAAGRANMKHQKTDSVGLLSKAQPKKGTDELAERLGISADMLQLARNTERLFGDSDKLIVAWQEKNTEQHEHYLAWVDERPTVLLPWTSWRDAFLKAQDVDPRDPKSVKMVPENYREIYEDLLFSGEMGLGNINKAVGSALATKGESRNDLNKGNPALHLTLQKKLKTFTGTMFGAWGDLTADHRLELSTKVAESVEQWPDEAQRATFQKLKTLFSK